MIWYNLDDIDDIDDGMHCNPSLRHTGTLLKIRVSTTPLENYGIHTDNVYQSLVSDMNDATSLHVKHTRYL